jgi:DNA topoisomerase III
MQGLMKSRVSRPLGGVDMGDHPPITPVAVATENAVGGGDDWRIYEYIARHFLATVSPDCAYLRRRAVFTAAGENFAATGKPPSFALL